MLSADVTEREICFKFIVLCRFLFMLIKIIYRKPRDSFLYPNLIGINAGSSKHIWFCIQLRVTFTIRIINPLAVSTQLDSRLKITTRSWKSYLVLEILT